MREPQQSARLATKPMLITVTEDSNSDLNEYNKSLKLKSKEETYTSIFDMLVIYATDLDEK